jgi:carbamoyltransferase
MKFLGIRNGHDCNIAYSDGVKVKYAKIERNVQIKHYNTASITGIDKKDDVPELLEHAKTIFGIDLQDLDGICISNDPGLHKLDREIEINEMWFEIDKSKNPIWDQFSCPVYRIDHHYSHTLSCWPLVDLDTVDTHFVFDGLGDHARVSGVFRNDTMLDYIDRYENNGLSVTMEQVGQQIGIEGIVLDIAGKLMALKSFHNIPDELTSQLMQLSEPLRYRHLNQFIELTKQAQRALSQLPDNKQQLINLSHLLHVFGEHKLPDYFSLYAKNNDIITYSGGTAQNTVVNTQLKKRFNNIYIPPHCPDDGLSLGCVEFLRKQFSQGKFDNSNFPYWQSDEAPDSAPTKSTINKTAELLAQGKIVGWYQGNGEIGPRALGNRSILMDPSVKNGKDILNAKVKKREEYRPFGASILSEYANQHFDCDYESPYMLYVIDALSKTDFPSVLHVDHTCRIQTVNEEPQYGIYRDLIENFRQKTGIPMVLNTSLNVNGKPIAGYKQDAIKLFNSSEMDAVVIGNEILVK